VVGKKEERVVKHPIIREHYVQVKIEQQEVVDLSDTGAICTQISIDTAQRLNQKVEPLSVGDFKMFVAEDGHRMKALGKAQMVIEIGGIQTIQQLSIVEKLDNTLIIGCDWMKQHRVVIDYGNQMISLTEDNVEVPFTFCPKSA